MSVSCDDTADGHYNHMYREYQHTVDHMVHLLLAL